MKILVIQQKMIGDVLISSILCDNLRIAYPDAIIDYLVYESTVDVLKGNKSISNLILFEKKFRKNKWELLKFLLRIRNSKYDVVIDAYTKIESILPVLFSGASKKISFDKKWRKYIFTHVVEKTKIPKSNIGLVIEQRLSLLNPLELNIELATFPRLFIKEDEILFARTIFKQHQISLEKKTVMVSIIGSCTTKTYPAEYMATIIDMIADQYDVNILFNYLPNQLSLADTIYNLCKKETREKIHYDVLGKNLREFIAIMNECAVIIGNDGGAINMAKGLEKPSYVIFSPWIDKHGWATFEDGIKYISVHLKDFKPELYTSISTKEIKKHHRYLYQNFDPSLFTDSLNAFLKAHLS